MGECDISPERRQEIADGLRRYFAQVDAKRRPMSQKEAEDVIIEALRSVKPDYRPLK